MYMKRMSQTLLMMQALLCLLLVPVVSMADIAQAGKLQAQNGVLQDYRRLLPLEGGSNFRDLGGYPTVDGRTVKRGLLYRSGVMTWLTEADMDYLAMLGIENVVDLRSQEELELFPNRWVTARGINHHVHDYSITELLNRQDLEDFQNNEPGGTYRALPYTIVPQLKQYFSLLTDGQAPLVVNCAAGQDRTGIASSLLLTALGVPKTLVIEDYLLSSDFRRPLVEQGTIDLRPHIKTNAFAALIAPYYEEMKAHAPPLVTPAGIPYLEIAFEQIEKDYGSVQNFMAQELGVSAADVEKMKSLYLE
jgi:protein-tyrosine phosphatase